MKRALLLASWVLVFLAWGGDGRAVAASSQRLFADNAPWNIPISPEDLGAAYGKTQIAAFLETGGTLNLNRGVWTVTELYADEKTPRYDIAWSKWLLRDVPIPATSFQAISYLKARGDTDRGLCIHDRARGRLYTFWKPRPDPQTPGSLLVQAGGVFSMKGSGWWDNSKEPWTGSASGRCYCAGLASPEEIARGEIPHALAATWPRHLIRSRQTRHPVVFPAKTTDGKGTDESVALPMGTRLQLDPSLTEDQLYGMGLRRGDIVLAKAMQKYGVFIVDSAEGFSLNLSSDLDKGLYPETTNPWPKTLMPFFRVIAPLTAEKTAPLENRFSSGEPSIRLP